MLENISILLLYTTLECRRSENHVTYFGVNSWNRANYANCAITITFLKVFKIQIQLQQVIPKSL